MGRTNQGGSVLSFVVVGVILAGLLVGGIYFVNQQTSQPPTPVSRQPEKSANKDDKQTKKQTPPAAEPGNKPQSETDTNTATELPATGPTELVGSLIVLGLLGGVVTSYLRSRRLQPLFDL